MDPPKHRDTLTEWFFAQVTGSASLKRARTEAGGGSMGQGNADQAMEDGAADLSGDESDQDQNMEAMLQITKAAGLASRAKDNEKNLTDASAGELFKYVIAIGIKYGALARDTLPEVVLEVTQGEDCP